MDDLTLAKVLHLCVAAAWTFGLLFEATTLMPAIRSAREGDGQQRLYREFAGATAASARLWIALTGLTGLYLVWRAELWARFTQAHYWWMHLMVLVWLFFALVLFVLEPRAARDPAVAERFVSRGFGHAERHLRKVSVLALVTFALAAAGAHGLI